MPLLEEAYAEAAPLMESDPDHGGGHSGEILAPSAGGGVLPVWACDAMLMSRASVMSKQTNYHIKKVCALLLLLLVSSIAVVGPAFLASLLVAPSGATRDGTTAGLQHPATRARLGRAFSTSASNSSAMSTVTAMDELSFVGLRTTKTTRTAFGGDGAQSEMIRTALQQMRNAGALMINGPANEAKERYKDAVDIYRRLPDELKKHEETRAELFHVSRAAVALNNGGVLESWIATSSSTNELFPDVLWEDEEFVLYAMLQVSCSKDEKTAKECAGDISKRRVKSRLVRSIYAERVSKHLLQKSVNILEALFRFATGPTANVRDPENGWLCWFLPLWDRKEDTWRPLGEGSMRMPVEVAERFFGKDKDHCANSDLEPVEVRACAALGAQMLKVPPGSHRVFGGCVPRHLLTCPMVVAGLLAAVADPTNAAAKWRTGLTDELGLKTAEVELLKRDPRVARAVLPNLADGSLNADDFPAALFQGATWIQRDFVWDAMLAIDSGPRFRDGRKTAVARIAGFALAKPTGEGVRPPDPRSFWADAVKHAGKLYTYVPPDLQGDEQFALDAMKQSKDDVEVIFLNALQAVTVASVKPLVVEVLKDTANPNGNYSEEKKARIFGCLPKWLRQDARVAAAMAAFHLSSPSVGSPRGVQEMVLKDFLGLMMKWPLPPHEQMATAKTAAAQSRSTDTEDTARDYCLDAVKKHEKQFAAVPPELLQGIALDAVRQSEDGAIFPAALQAVGVASMTTFVQGAQTSNKEAVNSFLSRWLPKGEGLWAALQNASRAA